MRVSYMKPGRRAREERLVSREFPDYKTDDRGEPSDAGAEEVRTYAAHHFCGCCCVNLQRLQHCIGYGAPVRLLQGPSCRVSAAAMAEVALIVQHSQGWTRDVQNTTFGADCGQITWFPLSLFASVTLALASTGSKHFLKLPSAQAL